MVGSGGASRILPRDPQDQGPGSPRSPYGCSPASTGTRWTTRDGSPSPRSSASNWARGAVVSRWLDALPGHPYPSRLGRARGEGRGATHHQRSLTPLPTNCVRQRRRRSNSTGRANPAAGLSARAHRPHQRGGRRRARAITRRSGFRPRGRPTARSSMTPRSWPRPSKGSGSSSHYMRFQGPLGIRSAIGGGKMEATHIPVLADEVMSMLAPAPRQPPGSTPPSAAVGTPSGSWRRPTLMAASSVLMPMGRPSPEWTVASDPASGIAWSCARRTSPPTDDDRPRGGLRAGRRRAVRPGPLSDQLRRHRSRLRLPGRRPARHAVRCHPGRSRQRDCWQRSTSTR